VASLESDFEPVDQQFTVGWGMSQDLQASGLTYEAGVQVGRDTGTVSGVAVSYTNLEFYGGPRYEFVLDKVHPYLSGGVSLLSADLEGSQWFVSVSDDDSSFGLYVGGGVDLDVGESMFLGVGLRQTFAHEVTLFGGDGDADFTQFFVRIGSSF
jgi:opacity protein-like surface antigen